MDARRKIRIRVGAVIIKDNRILLVEHLKDGKKYWLVPGGGVKYGETMPEALRREIKEEISVDIEVVDLLFSSDSISEKDCRHIVNMFFLCRYVSGNMELGIDKRLNSFGYFNAEELTLMKIIPPVCDELLSILKNKNSTSKKYAGSRWDEI